jgi:membrane protein implicated in regulation of membrane protease activity
MMRARSLVTILTIIGGLLLYALAIMVVAELLPPYWPAQTLFFAVAGLVWIVPAARFVKWMARTPPPTG